jgi:predicted small lipoprotein YifL
MSRRPLLAPVRCVALARAVAIAFALAGCGSRGPLDLDPPAAAIDALDAEAPLDAAVRDAPDAADARPPSILDCGLCVTEKCGPKVLRCIQDAPCSKALQCVGQKCLGGDLDLQCLGQCTGGDPATALKAFEIAQCVTGVCGSTCASGVTGLPGFPGLPGLPGVPGGG